MRMFDAIESTAQLINKNNEKTTAAAPNLINSC